MSDLIDKKALLKELNEAYAQNTIGTAICGYIASRIESGAFDAKPDQERMYLISESELEHAHAGKAFKSYLYTDPDRLSSLEHNLQRQADIRNEQIDDLKRRVEQLYQFSGYTQFNPDLGCKAKPLVSRVAELEKRVEQIEKSSPPKVPCSKPQACFECYSWCRANHVCKYEIGRVPK